MTYQCTEERALKDFASHQMTIIQDDGVHRHIRFKRHKSSAYWFDLLTWPGTLCIDGDMGTYVFRRLEDMFEFFRTDREYALRKGCTLTINPGYWGEKLQSIPRHGEGFTEFDADRFRDVVREYFDAWVEDDEPSEEAKEEVWEELNELVLSQADDGEVRAMDAAFGYENKEHEFEMIDFWDHNFKRYTFHFIWCCYAIAWGIQQYDTSKEAVKELAA